MLFIISSLLLGVILVVLTLIITLVAQAYSMYQTAMSMGIKRAVGARHGHFTNIAENGQFCSDHTVIARYKILVIGDSVVEGVGADHVYQTLGHQLVRLFGQSLAKKGKSNQIEYQLLGRSGYRALDIKHHLISEISPSFLISQQTVRQNGHESQSDLNSPLPSLHREYSTRDDVPEDLVDISCLDKEARQSLNQALKRSDGVSDRCMFTEPRTMLVLSCGGNHATRLHSSSRYQRELCELIDALRSKLGEECPVFLIGMPPMNIFPMPKLLRLCLGHIVEKYDEVQRTISRGLPHVYHLTALAMFTPAGMLRENKIMPETVHDAIDRLFDGNHKSETIDDVDGSLMLTPRLTGQRPTDPASLFAMMLGGDRFHPNYAGASIMAAISLIGLFEWEAQYGHLSFNVKRTF